MSTNLFDMHCHLDFLPDSEARALAERASERDIVAFSSTVVPDGFVRAQQLFSSKSNLLPNVRVGVGMHPWWVADGSIGEDAMELFERAASRTRFIGEVGLDFAPRRDDTQDAQVVAFGRALDACAGGGKVLSMHAVRSASTVLDMLEERRACEGNTCILHWFSGTSDELTRAIRMGCFFSINPRMMATKRGRAYVRVIPRERLLLETDMPAGDGVPYSVDEWGRDLRGVLEAVALARSEDVAELGQVVASTSARILGME